MNAPDNTFHFRVTLILPGHRGVRLDLNPDHSDPSNPQRGLLTIESIASPYAAEHTIIFEEPTLGSPSIQEILAFLLGIQKRHQYDFDKNGEGCRTWCEVVLKDIVSRGIIDGGASTRYAEWEEEKHAVLKDRFPKPKATGRFYQDS
jgi:hypothetical protein